jgi:hypothetical protein
MTYVDQLIRAVHDSCRHNTPQHIYHCADVDAARRIIETEWRKFAVYDGEPDSDYYYNGDVMTLDGWTEGGTRTIKIHLHRGGRNAAL